MTEVERETTEDEIVNYMPAMPSLSGGPISRFFRKLFRRRGGIRFER